ncbi:hypothetical protein [Cetobacterium somerae]|nr:hypothetical protein [Cetobacterium somerae]
MKTYKSKFNLIKNFQKKYLILLFLILLTPFKLHGNTIYPNLKLELFKNEITTVNGLLKFEKTKNKYNITFEINKNNKPIVLDTQNIKTKVKDVFLYDTNKDSVNEIFIIYSKDDKNYLEGYSLTNLNMEEDEYEEDEVTEFFKTFNTITSHKLNSKIANIKNFNVNLAKKELDKLTPYYKIINFNNYDWNTLNAIEKEEQPDKKKFNKYEVFPQDYERFNLQKYFQIYSLDNLNFIKYLNSDDVLFSNGKYYFLFHIHHLGIITLEEVFQGKITDEIIIKNGKYFNSFENGYYEKNIKVGTWNSYEYLEELKCYLPVKKYFIKGALTRKDFFYRKLGKLYKFSSRSKF